MSSWQQIKTFTGFAQGAHTVRLTAVASTCNGAAAGAWNLDAIRAYTGQKSYTYDDDNRLKQLVEGGSTTTFQYDPNGSVTTKTAGSAVTTYAWDGARRLTSVALNGAPQASFSYDGNGARTSKTAGGATTTYVNDTRDLTRVLQETKAGTTLTYVPGLTQHDPSKATETDRWSYFHADALSTRALTNNSAAVTLRLEYDPFGITRTQSGAAVTDFGFTEEQRDAETGLINLRARYYDPALGRFLSRDPLAGQAGFPQSLNRYQYALNNPLRFIDPTGYDDDQNYGNGDPSCCDTNDHNDAPGPMEAESPDSAAELGGAELSGPDTDGSSPSRGQSTRVQDWTQAIGQTLRSETIRALDPFGAHHPTGCGNSCAFAESTFRQQVLNVSPAEFERRMDRESRQFFEGELLDALTFAVGTITLVVVAHAFEFVDRPTAQAVAIGGALFTGGAAIQEAVSASNFLPGAVRDFQRTGNGDTDQENSNADWDSPFAQARDRTERSREEGLATTPDIPVASQIGGSGRGTSQYPEQRIARR